MCDKSSKLGSFGRFVMPILQGAAAGAQAAPGPRVGGGPGFGQQFFSGMGAGFQQQRQQKLMDEERLARRQEQLNRQAAEDRAQKLFDMNMENAQRQKDFFKGLTGGATPQPAPPLLGVEAPQKPTEAPANDIGATVKKLKTDYPDEAPGLDAAVTEAGLLNNPKPILDQINKVRTNQLGLLKQPTHFGDILPAEAAQKAYPDLQMPAGAKYVRVGMNRQNKPVSVALAPEPKIIPSLFGKMTPEMMAIGVPPDFRNYPAGVNDPKFQEDVKAYGQKVIGLKQKNALDLAETRGIGYAKGRALFTPFPVIDSQNDMSLDFVPAMKIINSPGRYLPAGQGATQQMKNAVFEDIKGASKLLRTAYSKLDRPFDADQRAALAVALSADPSGATVRSVVQSLGIGTARGQFTPAQADVVIATGQAVENAYALRSVAGFGQGSDELRAAIRATLPGAGTPDKAYAMKQLDAFDAQVNRLSKGVPKVPLRGTESGGIVKMKTPDGQVWNVPKDKVDAAKSRGATVIQ